MTTVIYDDLDRPTRRIAGLGSSKPDTAHYAYAADDRWTAAWNAESTDTLRFDVAGRLQYEVTRRGGSRYELQSAFNKRDVRTSVQMTAPSAWARTVSYAYTTQGMLTGLTTFGGTTVFGYNNDRQVTSIALPTSTPKLTIDKLYPSTHVTGQVTYSNAGTVNARIGVRYAQDAMQRVLQRQNAAQDSMRVFHYDRLGQLVRYRDYEATAPYCEPFDDSQYGFYCDQGGFDLIATSDSMAWDRVGNPTNQGASLAGGNRLTAYRGYTLGYDADGNLTSKVRNPGWQQYFYWDPLGQLDSVVRPAPGRPSGTTHWADGCARPPAAPRPASSTTATTSSPRSTPAAAASPSTPTIPAWIGRTA